MSQYSQISSETNEVKSPNTKQMPGNTKGIKSHFRQLSPDWGKISLLLSFIVPVVIMLVLFAFRGIFPFGRRSFLYSDMYHQYVPFFNEFMNKVKGGESLFYSFHAGLGSNFLALFAYYLASPLNWLAFLFPQKYLIEFMSYMVIIKLGLCGLTSCIYLRKRFNTNDFPILFFSCFYALSGFTAAYNYNVMWLDCVVLLPLILLGLERLVSEGKCALYCITLALAILSNFYLSILMCIFIVLYFIVLLLTEKRSLKIIGNFTLYSLLAGGMAAILVIPAVYALSGSDFGSMAFPKESFSYFSIMEVLARHCIGVLPERWAEQWPNIYCGVAIFLLLPMYALNNRIPIRRRFCFLALAGFMLVSFSNNLLNFIWHGFNYPNMLPCRQSFIYTLLVLVMGYEAFKEIQATNKKMILYCYLAGTFFLLGYEMFIGNTENEYFTSGIIMLTLVFLTVYAVLLYLYRTRKGSKWCLWLGVIALISVMLEAGINTNHTSIGTSSRSFYTNQLEDFNTLIAQAASLEAAEGIDAVEQPFYRLEKFTWRTRNDGLLSGYPTASLFSSTLNSDVSKLYRKWGMSSNKVQYCFDGATAFTGALLNVHYMFAEDAGYNSSLYQLAGSSGKIYLYESTATLPFGYVAPKGYDIPKGFTANGIRLQNRMVNELGVEGELFQPVITTQEEDSIILQTKQPGYYYMELLTPETTNITAAGIFGTKSYIETMENGIIYLGYLQENELVRVSKEEDDDDKENSDGPSNILLGGWIMNEDILRQTLSILSQASLQNVAFDTAGITGEINLEKEGRLILSIPYEKGWHILLDGEKVTPNLFGGTLMAFDLPAGQHKIALSYTPQGLYPGILISIVSILAFILLMRMKVSHKSNKVL